MTATRAIPTFSNVFDFPGTGGADAALWGVVIDGATG
jgi:hypothetical protein